MIENRGRSVKVVDGSGSEWCDAGSPPSDRVIGEWQVELDILAASG
jgi:hypothetical protein